METYEKKYKEAQKWIESIYTELNHERQMEAEAFFPELKESENERIRRWCITNQELSKWLREKPEEFREVTNKHNLIGSIHSYFEVYKNRAVAPDIMIRSNYGEWKEPLIEE